MKFTNTLLAFGLTVTAIATPAVVERDIKDITGVISDITTKVQSLSAAIKAYSGGDVSSIQSASDDIVSTTNSAVTTVKASDVLADTDALQLTAPIQSLTSDISDAIDALIAKKDQVVAADAGAQTYKDLQSQKTAASALAAALTSKVSDNLASIAATLSAGITDAIQKGIDAYEDVSSGGDSSSTDKPSTTTGGPEPSSTGGAETTTTGAAPSYPAGTGGPAPTGTGVTPPGSSGTQPPFTNGANSKAVSGVLGVAAFAAVLAF